MHVGLHRPGRRHRQADQPRRLRGSQRGHRPRRVFCIVEAAAHLGLDLTKADGRRPGLRQRRLDRRPAHRATRARPSSRSPTRPAASTTRPASTSTGSSPGRRSTAPSRASPARPTSATPSCSRSTATSSSRPPSRTRSPPATPATDQGEARRRGRQRPDDAGGRRDPRRERRVPDPGHPVQRRRRDRQLLRVGPGPQPRPLDRGRGQRQAQGDHGQGLRRDPRMAEQRRRATCGPRPTCWPSTGSPTPPRCAASTRKPVVTSVDGTHRQGPRSPPRLGAAGVSAVGSGRRCYHRGHARPRRKVPVQGGDPPPRQRASPSRASSTTSRTC